MSRGVEDYRWYAVLCRSRHEQIVADGLTQKGLTAFLPRIRETRNWSDRRKQIEMPLFPGYVFVKISELKNSRVPVLQTTGVVRFVGNMNTPLSIPEKEIEDVRAVVEQREGVSPYSSLVIGQRVRILGGALDGVEGTLMARDTKSLLVISIQLIQRSISLKAHNWKVMPLPATKMQIPSCSSAPNLASRELRI
jgi:transcription termination/antitermination protein NusG